MERQPFVDARTLIQEWVANAARAVLAACTARGLVAPLPRLLCEPGRSLVATAGVTLYTLGARKEIPASVASIAGAGETGASATAARVYVSIDGGMSDNPRPITYRAAYTAVLADRPILQADESGGGDHASPASSTSDSASASTPSPVSAAAVPMATVTVAGKHCESGDVLLPRVSLPADAGAGDILAVFVTGAYNYSMSSNYNRIPRPAMVMVPTDAAARVEVCLCRETPQELLRNDVVPSWLRSSGV
jgi:diaminopimelate decarboxylase